MFNLSGSEIIVILLLALVVLGPEKLPDALRRAGKTYAELKKMGNSFQSEMKSVLDEPMKEMRETADLLRKAVDISDLTDAVAGTEPAAKPAAAATTAAVAATTDAAAPADELAAATEPPALDTDGPAEVDTALSLAEPPAVTDPDEELINRTLGGGW